MPTPAALPATIAARTLRDKLRQLAERGIDGEAESARKKLARLEARYDFDAAPEMDEINLFAGFTARRSSGKAKVLKTTNGCSSDIASFIKWALRSAFNIEGALQIKPDGNIALVVEADSESVPTLNRIAGVIRSSFEALWAQFALLPGATERDAKTFLLGLYDGMMDDARAAGTPLPARTPQKKAKGRARKNAVAHVPGLAIHPYTVALDLGRKIRLSVPIGAIVEELGEQERIARLNAA